jgi:tRNA A37 N6-isopentenylltransferase MiaA
MSLISSASDGSSSEEEGEEKFAMMNTPSLYKELQKVDPQMAAKWHPGDRRKIAKSLKVRKNHHVRPVSVSNLCSCTTLYKGL